MSDRSRNDHNHRFDKHNHGVIFTFNLVLYLYHCLKLSYAGPDRSINTSHHARNARNVSQSQWFVYGSFWAFKKSTQLCILYMDFIKPFLFICYQNTCSITDGNISSFIQWTENLKTFDKTTKSLFIKYDFIWTDYSVTSGTSLNTGRTGCRPH